MSASNLNWPIWEGWPVWKGWPVRNGWVSADSKQILTILREFDCKIGTNLEEYLQNHPRYGSIDEGGDGSNVTGKFLESEALKNTIACLSPSDSLGENRLDRSHFWSPTLLETCGSYIDLATVRHVIFALVRLVWFE
jgi:hypothetical protein